MASETTHYVRIELPSVFPQPETAYAVMRDYATKCDTRLGGRCKSCGFLLKALDEIDLLRGSRSTLTTTSP